MNTIRNVVYIHTHDMGRYISPYGYDIPTPHLQEFAGGATLFRRAFCAAPTCSPSRAALLTGQTAHEAGMLGLAHRGFQLAHPERHLAAYLRRHGFYTALCGIQHEFEDNAPDLLPYNDVVTGRGEARDETNAAAAVAFLERPQERPFFLSLGLFYPHRPFLPADYAVDDPANIQPPEPLADTEAVRRDMADYHHTVRLSDRLIGDVLAALRKGGHDRDSLVIITTDHGIAFPLMKCNLTDHGIGVTLMLQAPGNPSAGQAIDGLVSHLDIYPTVCDLLGLEAPPHLEGHSLRPLLEGTAASVREDVFAEVTFHASYEPMRCVRTDRYKLIRRFGYADRRLANVDDSPSKAEMVAADWHRAALPALELYDCETDPHEQTNRAGDPALATVQTELEARLRDWMERTNDPLLQGEVPRPPGAKVNVPESVGPGAGPYEP